VRAASAAIAVMIVGAILTFALKTGYAGGFDLHIVGIILMLGGASGLLLPLLFSSRSRWSQSTVRSRQDVIDDGPPPVDPPGYNAR
jgi:predicted membrane channel-forming protein YqfA (hemolysin III family)